MRTLSLLLALVLAAPMNVAFAADETIKEFEYTGASPQTSFQLKHEQNETVYETRQVPDTCTRQVPDGFDTECTPITRTECSDERVWECTPTTRRECENTTRRECHTEYREDCDWTTRRECENTTRRECRETTRRECTGGGVECRDVEDQVCRTGPDGNQICQSVTRRVCEQQPQDCRDVPSTECRDIPDQVCRDVPDRVCRRVPYEECRNVPDTVCRDVPDQDCGYVTRRQCREVPDQVCRQVQRYRTESYACTRTVQVPVGERLVMQTLGKVTAKFGATPQGTRPDEDFIAQLSGSSVGLKVKKASGQFLVLSAKKEEVKQVDATHRVVTTGFDISFIPLAEVTSPVSGIPEASLSSTQLSFQLGRVVRKEFLTLDVAITHVSSGREILRRAIPVDKVTFQDGRTHTNASISLSDLGLREALVPGKYRLGLSAGIRATGVEGLLNPDALAGIRPATYQKDHVVTFDSPELNAQTVLNMVGGGLQDVKLTAQELSFTVGKIVAREYVSLDLKLARQRYLSGPLTLSELTLWDPDRDRELPRYLKLTDQGARTKVAVNLSGIRLTEQVGKLVYVVGLRASLKKERLSGLIEDSLLESAQDALHDAEYRELAPPAEQVLAMTAGGVEGIELSTSRAQFTLGKVVAPEALTVRLTLKKDGVFGDKLIFDGHLKLGEGSANTRVVDAGGGRSKLLVDLSRLPLEETVQSGKKYVFKVGAALNRDTAESILTAEEIYRAREAEAELKLKANP